MKSGKKPIYQHEITQKINISDYNNGAHAYCDCGGAFEPVIREDCPMPIPVLGTIVSPIVVFTACPECRAAYIPEGFEEHVCRQIAVQLVLTRELLSKDQIRFLRVFMGFTQEKVADAIGASDRHHYSKMESSKTPVSLSPDKQVRLKLFYAKALGVNDPEKLYGINEPDLDHVARIRPEALNFETATAREA